MLISGLVIKGLGIGKKLGLPPTMNLRIRRIPKSLRHGIYAVFVKTPRPSRSEAKQLTPRRNVGATLIGEFKGVLHYGPRPAVHAPLSFEVHCFGLKKNLYGKRVSVEVKKRIRAIKNFPSIRALQHAINRDIKASRRFFTKKRGTRLEPLSTN